ncbi:MAG TPA: NADP-dependent oxidoreductase [Ramlibacter sp.]|nr:NADP-dependent oxidoreductase [Ramlibacter sp.]
MKAVRIHEYGGADVLRVEDVPVPAPGPGQVLLKVEACGINPLDAWFRSGHLAGRLPRALPFTPGWDVAGTVVAAAEGVTGPAKGDRVMGILNFLGEGAYAEFAVADAARLIARPDGLQPVQAAAAMTPGLTGLQMIDKALSLGACKRILLLGALGAVGRAAMAAAVENRLQVTAMVRPGREEEALQLGAHEVVSGEDTQRISALEGHFDVILDTIGPQAVARWENALAPGGIVLSVVPMPPFRFSRQDVKAAGIAVQPDTARLAALATMVACAKVTLPAIEVLTLREARLAHEILPGASGRKFVLVPG